MIAFKGLTKRYGKTQALFDLTATVNAGRVTGLLGPNGAGKSTVLRLLLGLDHPTAGAALINGRPYRSFRRPLRVIGSHLEGRTVHPGRTARAHLVALARVNSLPAARVDAVIQTVGLGPVASRRTGGFSLGMLQRLGVASALLGEPEVLVLDEPVNGLDTDGIRWLRTLLIDFAREGGTVLLASHVMAELQQTADHVIVLGRGRLLADCPVDDLVRTVSTEVCIDIPDARQRNGFAAAVVSAGMPVEHSGPIELRIHGGSPERIGNLAHEHSIRIHRLTQPTGTLEDGYLRLVENATEFTSASVSGGAG